MSSLNSRERLLQSVISALRALDGELDLMNQAIGNASGLNRTEAQCMDIISRDGPVTPSALAERIGLTPGAITTILDRLEARGWVVRRHDREDRRRVRVDPTENRQRQLRPIFRGLQRATRDMTQGYTIDQLELIVEFLARTTAVVRAHRKSIAR